MITLILLHLINARTYVCNILPTYYTLYESTGKKIRIFVKTFVPKIIILRVVLKKQAVMTFFTRKDI